MKWFLSFFCSRFEGEFHFERNLAIYIEKKKNSIERIEKEENWKLYECSFYILLSSRPILFKQIWRIRKSDFENLFFLFFFANWFLYLLNTFPQRLLSYRPLMNSILFLLTVYSPFLCTYTSLDSKRRKERKIKWENRISIISFNLKRNNYKI